MVARRYGHRDLLYNRLKGHDTVTNSETQPPADNSSRESPLRVDEIDASMNVLIAGPAMTHKRKLALSILGDADEGGNLFISTKKNATQLRREYHRETGRSGDRLHVVDCVSKEQGFGKLADEPNTRYVSNTADLTGIGIAATGIMQHLYHDDSVEDIRIGLSSLSTMLMFADLRRVYQFVHVLTGRIETAGFRGVFTLDSTKADADTLGMLKQLFDVFVETRETDEGLELRVRGEDIGPREWTPY